MEKSSIPKKTIASSVCWEMQLKAQKDFDATTIRDGSLPVFGVGVAFIDEGELHPSTAADLDIAVEEIVLNLAPPRKELPIRNVYYSTETLKNLVNTVADATGKEDLLAHICMLCLQKIAIEMDTSNLC